MPDHRTHLIVMSLLAPCVVYSQTVIEIDGSPFATKGAPLPETIQGHGEKTIIIYSKNHVWGAYNQDGKLIRWGVATAGAKQCPDLNSSCKTASGIFRIYSAGDVNCSSRKYGDAPMPYCMYFKGGQALHGSSDVRFENVSHGCVRIHIADAKWLRYHFIETPSEKNQYRGTQIMIKPY